jgi:DHA1 family bicyclomycin/chloramphenicol resistance-like MFS transporter
MCAFLFWYNAFMHKTSHLVISLVLASLAALAPFAIDTYLPAFPTMAEDLHGTNLQLQQSLTAYLLPYAVMTLWHGAISDSIGRLAAIRWGLGVFALASVGCALAPNIETLWFFRALQGASAGAGNVVARAMVRDLFEGVAAQRVMAQVQMIFGIAPAVAPIIGGWLLGIHWQAIFIFLSIYAIAALGAAQVLLPETVPPEKRVALSTKQVISGYKQAFGDAEFTKLVFAVGANFAGFFVYVLAAPVFLIEHLKLNAHQFGYMFIPTVCGMIFGSYLARHAAGKYSTHKVMQFAYGWMACATLLNIAVCLWLPVSPLVNILPIALYNIGMALGMPILSLAGLDRMPKLRGTAASGQAFMQMLLSTVSAGLVVPLMWFSPLGLAIAMAAYLLLSYLVIRQTMLWHLG